MPVSVGKTLAIIFAVSGTIFLTRLIPFLFFPKGKELPPMIRYLGRVLPPAVIGMLVVYCLKAVSVQSVSRWAPELLAGSAVLLLHVWKRSNLLSIGAGTVLYMRLVQTVFAG